MVTAYKINSIVLFPKSDRQKLARIPRVVSKEWFVLPGRRVMHISELVQYAERLNTKLEKVCVQSWMPMDKERVVP